MHYHLANWAPKKVNTDSKCTKCFFQWLRHSKNTDHVHQDTEQFVHQAATHDLSWFSWIPMYLYTFRGRAVQLWCNFHPEILLHVMNTWQEAFFLATALVHFALAALLISFELLNCLLHSSLAINNITCQPPDADSFCYTFLVIFSSLVSPRVGGGVSFGSCKKSNR